MTLTRKTPLTRTPFQSKDSATKKAPAPRQRKCAVKTCRALFTPRSMTHKTCSPECAIALVQAEKQKTAKIERQAGLAALKSKNDWIKEAQRAFNAYIRERDKEQPCICCGRVKTNVTGLHSHGWDAGHYRSTGSAPHLRFNEDNVHRQLVYCNRDRAGNAVEYRAGLIARIGLARVEALESSNVAAHWTIDDLKAIKATYVAKLKALKKGT